MNEPHWKIITFMWNNIRFGCIRTKAAIIPCQWHVCTFQWVFYFRAWTLKCVWNYRRYLSTSLMANKGDIRKTSGLLITTKCYCLLTSTGKQFEKHHEKTREKREGRGWICIVAIDKYFTMSNEIYMCLWMSWKSNVRERHIQNGHKKNSAQAKKRRGKKRLLNLHDWST